MEKDFSIFLQPGFWITLGLLTLMIAVAAAVIAYGSSYPVPSILG